MNKYKIIELLTKIEQSKIVLMIGLSILFFGLGATHQANNDINALNQSLYNLSNSNTIITDGTSYYSISLYKPIESFNINQNITKSDISEYKINMTKSELITHKNVDLSDTTNRERKTEDTYRKRR